MTALGPIGRLGRWAAAHARAVFVAWAAIALVFGFFAPRVETALSGAGWEATGSESVFARTLVDQNFRGLSSSGLMVVVHAPGQTVHGLVFEISEKDWPIIQHKEGVVTGMCVERPVRVKLADVARLAPFDALGLSSERHTTVLVDPWSASGPDAVRSAVRNDGWNPLGHFPYRPLQAVVTPIEPFVAVLEGASPPDIGRVDPDFVPADRIR